MSWYELSWLFNSLILSYGWILVVHALRLIIWQAREYYNVLCNLYHGDILYGLNSDI